VDSKVPRSKLNHLSPPSPKAKHTIHHSRTVGDEHSRFHYRDGSRRPLLQCPDKGNLRSFGAAIAKTWTGLGGKIKKLGRKRQENSNDNSKDPTQADSEQSKSDYPIPQTMKELEALCWAINAKCTCDICVPDTYTNLKCSKLIHILHRSNEELGMNKYGYTCFRPPPLAIYRSHPPPISWLTRILWGYFDVSWEYLNYEQLLAREELLKWIANRKDMMDVLETLDGPTLVPAKEMRQLLKWILELFVGGDIPSLTFSWQGNLNYTALSNPRVGKNPAIRMHPSCANGTAGRCAVLGYVSVRPITRNDPCDSSILSLQRV
jgi:hypothetical protein